MTGTISSNKPFDTSPKDPTKKLADKPDQKPLVTIDGPSASGKSSVARALAQERGWQWLSTGAFYRGLGWVALEQNIDLNDEPLLLPLITGGQLKIEMVQETTKVYWQNKDITENIYQESVGQAASSLSRHEKLRENLLAAQRDCYQNARGGLVAEGRDCGTVVFPDAPLKVYLTAKGAERAKRRAQQEGLSIEVSQQETQRRDTQDTQRKVAPLVAAKGAVTIDTSQYSLPEVIDQVLQIAKSYFP